MEVVADNAGELVWMTGVSKAGAINGDSASTGEWTGVFREEGGPWRVSTEPGRVNRE